MVNLQPYLGAQEKESRQGVPLAQDVVLRLVSPEKSKEYNITTDNFFTNVGLAEKLKAIVITVVGTIRANSKGITKAMTAPVKGDTNKSTFYYNEKHDCLFVNYQCKIKKSVCLLSTIHNSPSVNDSAKNKPYVILFYNKNKVGVDVVDQMVRKHLTHSGLRRWPAAVWCNILNIAALNAWILYKKATEKTILRKKFIFQLIEELRAQYIRRNTEESTANNRRLQQSHGPKKRRKCTKTGCPNATVTICRACKSPTCGKCATENSREISVICKQCQANQQ